MIISISRAAPLRHPPNMPCCLPAMLPLLQKKASASREVPEISPELASARRPVAVPSSACTFVLLHAG